MKRPSIQEWLIRAVAIVASLALSMHSDLLPGTAAGTVWSAEDPIWELQPYRVRVLLCADESPLWTNTRLTALMRDIERRSVAEFGQRWQLTVEVATDEVRQAAAACGQYNGAEPADAGRRWPRRHRRADTPYAPSSLGRTDRVNACTYDVASHGWSRGPQHSVGTWNHLTYAVFESLAEAVTPLAMVKSIANEKCVLRCARDCCRFAIRPPIGGGGRHLPTGRAGGGARW